MKFQPKFGLKFPVLLVNSAISRMNNDFGHDRKAQNFNRIFIPAPRREVIAGGRGNWGTVTRGGEPSGGVQRRETMEKQDAWDRKLELMVLKG